MSLRRTLFFVLPLVALGACHDGAAPDPMEPDVEPLRPTPPTMNPLSMEVEGYPEPGLLRSGWMLSPAGIPMEIYYEIHDGFAIWQGDIVLGTPDDVAATQAELAQKPGPLRGVVIDADGGNNRWPGGVVPYTISTSAPPTQSIVDGAIDWIEDQTPGVTLIPRTTESDYVTFQDGSGCSSSIGRVGGQQFITLKVNDGVSFCSTGNAAHEILHALAMYHEHTRCDRNSFVTIDYAEVESGRAHNFYRAGATTETGACSGAYDIGAYDFGSMMHYGTNAFAVGTNPTIIPIAPVPPGVTIGQRNALSATDAATIDQLYGANNAAPVPTVASLAATYDEGTPVPFDASGTTDADDDDDLITFAWIFGDGTCPGPAACTDDDPDHPYADNGVFGWTVTVSDGFDDASTGATITILNVPPTVSAGADATIDEGDTFAQTGSFTDPGADVWTATVDYDDGVGAVPLPLSGKSFSLSHTYPDNGLNTVVVEVMDDDGGVGTDDVDVTVHNVPPSVEAGPDATVDSGETYHFSGTFSDPGVLDAPWTWVLAWGFGPDTNGSTDDQSAPIQASRQVCVAGTYTVSLTVTDKDGGVGADDLTLTVPYIPVEIDIMPGSDRNPINLGAGGTVAVAVLGSDVFDAAAVDPATLTLGDESDPDTAIRLRGGGVPQASLEDVNGDGYLDLVAHFPIRELVDSGDLTDLSTDLVLRGFETDGCTNIRGVDVVDPIGT